MDNREDNNEWAIHSVRKRMRNSSKFFENPFHWNLSVLNLDLVSLLTFLMPQGHAVTISVSIPPKIHNVSMYVIFYTIAYKENL